MRRFRGTGQRENGVTILFQASDQGPADSAGSTGNQDSHAISAREVGCEPIDIRGTLLPKKGTRAADKTLRDASSRATKAFYPALSMCELIFSGVFGRHPALTLPIGAFDLPGAPTCSPPCPTPT